MGRKLFAMAAAVMLMATWAAAQYQVCEGEYAGFCKWGSDCSAISIDPGASWSQPTCAAAYDNCMKNGEGFTDALCTNRIPGGAEACGSYCQWGPDCWEIKTDPTGANGTPSTDCVTAIANCDRDGAGRWTEPPATGEGPGQCGGTMVGGIQACGSYCKWDDGCYEIKPDPTGEHGNVTTNCEEAIAACDRDGARFSNSACTGTQIGGDEACGAYCLWDGTDCVEIKTDKEELYNPAPVTSCVEALANCNANGAMYSDLNCTVPTSVKIFGSAINTTAPLRASYTKGSITVNWTAASRIASGTISLVNVKGVTAASTSVKANSSNISAKLGFKSTLPAGMYFVRVDARDVNGKRIVSQVPVQIVK